MVTVTRSARFVQKIAMPRTFRQGPAEKGRKPGLVDSELDSQSKGRAFESYTRWKWCQSQARSIKIYPILVHSIIEENKFENTGSQMGHTKKNI